MEDFARDQIATVVRLAKLHSSKADLLDLIHEGNVGLLEWKKSSRGAAALPSFYINKHIEAYIGTD